MKRKSTLILGTGLAGIYFMLGGAALRAQTQTIVPVSMTASLVGPSTVSMGEPILLKYTIKNSNDLTATLFTPEIQGVPAITQSLTEVGGTPLVPTVSRLLPTPKVDVMSNENSPNLQQIVKNGSLSWQVLTNGRIVFPHPGSYLLRVHAHLGYVLGDVDQSVPVEEPQSVSNADYVFPLTVVAANPVVLQATATRLRRSIMQTDMGTRMVLTKALLSMPEASAAEDWQRLIEEPTLNPSSRIEVAGALADHLTIKSADLLAEIIWEPVQPPFTLDGGVFENEDLYDMYDSGNPALRKHIEDLYKQHGAAMLSYRM